MLEASGADLSTLEADYMEIQEIDGALGVLDDWVTIEREVWRQDYNTKRPHSSLGYRPPAPEVVQWPASPSGAASPATPAVAPGPVMH